VSRSLILDISDDIEQSLDQEARLTGKSREEVAKTWLRQHVPPPERGTLAAILPSFGVWAMSAEERLQIEQMIQSERDIEDDQE